MNHKDLDVALAHYMYLPAEDFQTAKGIWDGLLQKYDLVGLKLGDVIPNAISTTYDFPILVRSDSVTVGFSIIRNVIAIEILYPLGVKAHTAIIEELEESRQLFKDQIDYLTGETTVMVLNGQAKDNFDFALPRPFAGQEICNGDLKCGNLSLVQSDDLLRRYYVVNKENSSNIADILTSGLPSVDVLLFKMERQASYFKEQRAFIEDKKSDIDRNISDILIQRAGVKSSSEENISLLEKDVEELSLMYSELAVNLKSIKNAHDIVARDLETLEFSMKSLIASPDGLERFKDAVADEHNKLLKQLKFDDELLHRSLDDIRATIEVVRTRIELERSRESFILQKEGVSIQIAAGFIELFIVGFYTLKTWEILATKEVFEHIPAFITLGLDLAFAVTAVAFTHYIAKYLRKERARLGMTLSALGIIASLVLMIAATKFAAWS